MFLRTATATILTVCSAAALSAQRPITSRDLWSLARVGNPVLSPDAQRVAYTITRYDLESFRSKTEIWVVPSAGGEAKAFVTSEKGNNSAPAWSPDGKQLAFVSSRGGSAQVYLMPATGGEARAVTNVAGGAVGPVWSADGRRILFTSSVAPAGDSLAKRLERLAAMKSEAKIYDEVGYRHWDEWEDGQRSHVFVLDVASGATRDVTPGPYDTPPIALEGFQDYSISPDGHEVAFVRNTDTQTMVGTGNDVWLVPADGGEPTLLTESDANDTSPVYSPDGRYIAYLGMTRAGFESDRTQLMLYDRTTKQKRSLTPSLDLSVDFFTWSADSKTLYFLAGDQLNHSVFKAALAGGAPVRITEGSYNSGLAVSADGKLLVVARQAVDRPVELYALDATGKQPRTLTRTNDALLKQLALQRAEFFWFDGAAGTKVQGFIVKPPNFDATKKYPVVFLIHGGPQGSWPDSWSYRWNPNMFAAPGHLVVAVNPRGSTGYGQRFTDEISGDWGGKVYTDLMNGLDYALATYPFADRNRVAAAGASYGGYMINWLNGHTNRFAALINHDGIFDTRSMYGSTEELWFPEWEFKGKPWENPQAYEQWNPAASAAKMRTPTLVIHGGLDYRVPLEQGLMTFSTLRRQNVASRFLYFPDEGHWVLKPQNAVVWWDTMLGWLARYIGPDRAVQSP
jgi:dipeptidyl aminopeptidase/acylaminoacyl peptidase